MTHGPPYGILDKTNDGSNVGCTTLATRLEELRPVLHVFGHIHEAHGAELKEWQSTKDTSDATVFVNASNYPSGTRSKDGHRWVDVGTKSFMPVIVDLNEA